MKQYYRVADLVVEMDSFGRTATQAEPYLIPAQSQSDICISTDWCSFQARHPHLSDEDSEYLMSGSSFYHQLVKFDGLMLHSSAVL